MTPDEFGIQLHDRATRGEVLTADEQSQLDSWYAIQDAQESERFKSHRTESDASHLQSQIDTALSQLTSTTQHIQKVSAENDAIREEIASLKQHLSSTKSA